MGFSGVKPKNGVVIGTGTKKAAPWKDAALSNNIIFLFNHISIIPRII